MFTERERKVPTDEVRRECARNLRRLSNSTTGVASAAHGKHKQGGVGTLAAIGAAVEPWWRHRQDKPLAVVLADLIEARESRSLDKGPREELDRIRASALLGEPIEVMGVRYVADLQARPAKMSR